MEMDKAFPESLSRRKFNSINPFCAWAAGTMLFLYISRALSIKAIFSCMVVVRANITHPSLILLSRLDEYNIKSCTKKKAVADFYFFS
jgi:hypothetical protein